MDRIPYKLIGARIGKTDLACRLHFHQMVMAKRTPETPPGRSIVFLSSDHPPEVHRLAPMDSTSAASMALSAICEHDTSSSDDGKYHSSRLYSPSVHRRSNSTPHVERDHFAGWHPMASPYTSARTRPDEYMPSTADSNRLDGRYKQRANDFWSTISSKDSDRSASSPPLGRAFPLSKLVNVEERTPILPRITLTPSEPIDITRTAQITPHDTIRSHGPRHARSISDTSIAGRCSVEALLNHGRT